MLNASPFLRLNLFPVLVLIFPPILLPDYLKSSNYPSGSSWHKILRTSVVNHSQKKYLLIVQTKILQPGRPFSASGRGGGVILLDLDQNYCLKGQKVANLTIVTSLGCEINGNLAKGVRFTRFWDTTIQKLNHTLTQGLQNITPYKTSR